MDIFNADAFSMASLTAAVNKQPRLPTLLGDMQLFTVKNSMTEVVSFEENSGTLGLIQTSPRGAPLAQRQRDARKLRHLAAPRIAKGDSIQASELANMRAFGTESEMAVVQTEVAKRNAALVNDVNLTWENMRLGAVQGIVMDADGTTTLYDLYSTFNVTQPTEVDFDLDAASPASGVLRKACAGIVRATKNAAQNGWIQGRTYVAGLCDDTFWDQLIAHQEVRATYLNQVAAAELRGDAHTGRLSFGGIEFIHYEGTDGSAESASVKVPTGKCKFFPVDAAPDFWQVVFTPGEFFPTINQPGQPLYALSIPDRDRDAYVGLEVYSYPLFVCTRPLALQRARNT
jgi:hypothetical protein